jgi:hypothetical protein
MGNHVCFAADDAFPVQLPIQNYWELVVALDSESIKFQYSG